MDLLKHGQEGKAYLLKQPIDNVGELTHAIEAVASGRSVLNVTIARKLAEEYSAAELTDYEQWVLALLAEGYTDIQVLRTTHIDWNALEEILESLSTKLNLPKEETNQRNIQAMLALIDPHDRLRSNWVAGYQG